MAAAAGGPASGASGGPRGARESRRRGSEGRRGRAGSGRRPQARPWLDRRWAGPPHSRPGGRALGGGRDARGMPGKGAPPPRDSPASLALGSGALGALCALTAPILDLASCPPPGPCLEPTSSGLPSTVLGCLSSGSLVDCSWMWRLGYLGGESSSPSAPASWSVGQPKQGRLDGPLPRILLPSSPPRGRGASRKEAQPPSLPWVLSVLTGPCRSSEAAGLGAWL